MYVHDRQCQAGLHARVVGIDKGVLGLLNVSLPVLRGNVHNLVCLMQESIVMQRERLQVRVLLASVGWGGCVSHIVVWGLAGGEASSQGGRG